MPGGVHVVQAGMHHLGTLLDQAADHTRDVVLVAWDGMRTQDDRVVGSELQETVLRLRQSRERRHRFALGAGADHANLTGRQVVHVLYVHNRFVRDVEQAHLAGHRDVAHHRAAQWGDLAAVCHRCVRNLLYPVDVAGEAGRDDPAALVLVHQVVQHRADG
jgi:hypothetical protein